MERGWKAGCRERRDRNRQVALECSRHLLHPLALRPEHPSLRVRGVESRWCYGLRDGAHLPANPFGGAHDSRSVVKL
jgi:hypothetical protein